MSLSMRAQTLPPRTIAGGFVLVPVRGIIATWRACRRRPLGVADFRTWLACREMVARRCTLDERRAPTYAFAELARLTGVAEKRARASVNRLVAAGHLVWSDQLIAFPDTGDSDDALADTIGGGQGNLAIPRRILRILIGGARPALIATVLALLLRCLARGRGGFRSRGRVKASWIARVFGVDLRRVKQARKDLVDLGWIVPEETEPWSENRWGRAYTIDLGWDRAAHHGGSRLPPPPAQGGRQLPPPDLDPEPLREEKHQEPASGGPTGVEIKGTENEPISRPTQLPPVPSHLPRESEPESGCRQPALDRGEAGTSPAPVEPGQPVPQDEPVKVRDGARGGPLPAPRLDDVRVEDLKDTGRLLGLLAQAIAQDLVGSSEADRLKFVAVAEHARAVGTVNPCGLFARLVRRGWWHFATQDDEDAASSRLKRHLYGAPREVGDGGGRSSALERRQLSADALLVREVKAASMRAGYRGDPYPLVRARDGSWTRERWDAALSELGVPWSGI